jgi:sortase A
MIMGWLRHLERMLLVAGVLMLGVYLAARIHRSVLSRAELDRFKTQELSSTNNEERLDLVAAKPDFSLWSPKRIKDYEESLAAHFSPAVAILRIPKIHVEVPVLEGTDDWSLNRGVGLIEGTARPGGDGNIGIAGHRDGFFRGLKDIGTGDMIQMVTADKAQAYVVDRVVIVSPADVSVLTPRLHSLTLVTCYPFYFVGSAPQRYIVQATTTDSTPANTHRGEWSNVEARDAQQQNGEK